MYNLYMEGLPKIKKENDIEKTKIKEGVDFVFEQNPEIAQIGTKEQYSKYLDSIFPESKINNIVYHGTSTIEKTGEKISVLKNNDGLISRVSGLGKWFTFEKETAKLFAEDARKRIDPNNPKRITFDEFKLKMQSFSYKYPEVNLKEIYDKEIEWYSDEPYIIPVIINVDSIKYFNNNNDLFLELTESPRSDRGAGGSLIYNWRSYDALVQEKGDLNYERYNKWTEETGSQILLKDANKSYILGSNKDIENFKKFVENHQNSQT